MKKIFIVLAIAAFGFASCQTNATKDGGAATADGTAKVGRKIKTQSDSISYAVGVVFGENIKGFAKDAGSDANMEVILAAIKDVQDDKYTLTIEQAQSAIQHYFTFVLPEKKLADEAKFLADVQKTNPNVKKTESGLLYDIIEAGSDVRATKMTDKVKVMYKGTLKDGTVFDSSYDEGREPAEFPLNGVIKGWGEGLMLIGEGGSIKLWIPSELGYGQQGFYNMIGPNEPLVFEVELMSVTPSEE